MRRLDRAVPGAPCPLGALAGFVGIAVGIVAAVGPGPAGARSRAVKAPRPSYGAAVPDAVTTDNAPRPARRPEERCPAAGCVVADANPEPPGRVVDSYTADTYERPVSSGPDSGAAMPALDITSTRAGASGKFLFYRIDLAGPAVGGGLPFSYAFEIDYDDDPAGDLLVRLDNPKAALSTTFAATGVVAFWNQNSNAAGPNPGAPDGPGASPDGYERRVFDGGANTVDGAPGGERAVLARVAPDRESSLEVVVDGRFIQAINDDLPAASASFRATASRSTLPESSYYLHDRFGRRDVGSPYPFLRLAGAPAECPNREVGLNGEQRAALDSGTSDDTRRPNPCYPSRAPVAEMDNTGFTSPEPGSVGPGPGTPAVPAALATPAGPDLALSGGHPGDFAVGRAAALTLTTTNLGGAPTTSRIQVVARLPGGLAYRGASGPGWSCDAVGGGVRCLHPGPLAPGGTIAVRLSVSVGRAAVGEITASARVVSGGDADSGNDTATDVIRVLAASADGGGEGGESSLWRVAGALAVAGLATFAARHRRRRQRPQGSA